MRDLRIDALMANLLQSRPRGTVEGGPREPYPKPTRLLAGVGAMILVALGVGLAVDHLVHLLPG